MAKKRPVVAENVADSMSVTDSKLASMFEKAPDMTKRQDTVDDDQVQDDGNDALPDVMSEMSFTDQLNALQRRNADLITENDDLKSKIADYLIELDGLREQKSSAETSDNIKVIELERKCKELEDATDKYLMRISELTFDNARLNASVQQLQNDIQKQNVQTPSAPVPVARPATHVERPTANPYSQNGYSSWN